MNDITMVFVENTKRVIKEKGYKQTFVAKKMNMTDRKLSDILNYRKMIDVEIIAALCKVLEVEPNELLGYAKTV